MNCLKKEELTLKGFEQNKNANSLSFFSKDGSGFISEELTDELVSMGKKLQETVRICLHANPEDTLQLMVIFHPIKKEIPIQKFLKQTSIYMAIEGEFKLSLLDEDFNVKEEHFLSKNQKYLYQVPAKQFFKMEMISSCVLFAEIRNGPFNKEEQILV